MGTERQAQTNDEILAEIARQQHQERTWQPVSQADPFERHHAKLHQAEMLAHTLSGSDEFEGLQRNIRAGVLWLLSDLLTEAREAHDEAVRLSKAKSNVSAAEGGK